MPHANEPQPGVWELARGNSCSDRTYALTLSPFEELLCDRFVDVAFSKFKMSSYPFAPC